MHKVAKAVPIKANKGRCLRCFAEIKLVEKKNYLHSV